MSAKRNAAQKVPADIALVVFGTDRAKKHHASRFGVDAMKSAQEAARAMGMRALRVVSDEQREVARRLPKGTVSAKGRTVVPLVTPALYNKLLAIAGTDAAPPTPPGQPPVEAGKKPASPTEPKAGKSDGWDGLVRGSLVLANDPDDEAYYFCVVQHVDVESGNISLLWRDYPELGKFSRKISQVALLHPDLVKHVGR